MNKNLKYIFIILSVAIAVGVIFLAGKLFLLGPKEVVIKSSIVKIDKSNPNQMRLWVKKFDMKKGRYRPQESYLIKGVVYQVVKIGQNPPWYDNWMTSDDDPAHRARVDLNKNGKLEENESEVGDFQLMKEMGVNTIRLYDPPGLQNNPDPFRVTPEEVEAAKKMFRELYSEYGIMVILGHSFGYCLDYSDVVVRQQLYDDVIEMVKNYKDEPWVLLWNLGNENNIQRGMTSGDFINDYYKETIQRIAHAIKKIDPNHPVSISSLGLAGVYDFDKHCPDVDIYGANMYQSRNFSGLWNTARRINRPAYLTEFGSDALDSREDPRRPNETLQANFVKKQWENIEANHHGAAGTSLGGIYFEWLDEWWKAPTDTPDIHTREGGWDAPTFDSGTRESGNEEWWGICAQAESGEDSPNYRHLRELYYVFKRLWTK